jgi:hypothetical protein
VRGYARYDELSFLRRKATATADQLAMKTHLLLHCRSAGMEEEEGRGRHIYFLNGGLRKEVVKFLQCVKFIFLTTHERTFQPSLRGVEKLVSKWSEN